MKKSLLSLILIFSTAALIGGCATKSSSSRADASSQTGTSSQENAQTAEPATKEDKGPRIIGKAPPKGSPFSKISLGMPQKQVYDLIGEPSDTSSYMTGKAFIPFYFGSDATRLEAFYKGQGRITFAGGSGFTGGRGFKVYYISYDPSEDGYNNR